MRAKTGWRPARPAMHSRPCSPAITSRPRRAWWLLQPGHHGSSRAGSRCRSASCRSSRLRVTPSSASVTASTASATGSANPSECSGSAEPTIAFSPASSVGKQRGPERGDLVRRHDRRRGARVVERDDGPSLVDRLVQPADRQLVHAREQRRGGRARRRVLHRPAAQYVERLVHVPQPTPGTRKPPSGGGLLTSSAGQRETFSPFSIHGALPLITASRRRTCHAN